MGSVSVKEAVVCAEILPSPESGATLTKSRAEAEGVKSLCHSALSGLPLSRGAGAARSLSGNQGQGFQAKHISHIFKKIVVKCFQVGNI